MNGHVSSQLQNAFRTSPTQGYTGAVSDQFVGYTHEYVSGQAGVTLTASHSLANGPPAPSRQVLRYPPGHVPAVNELSGTAGIPPSLVAGCPNAHHVPRDHGQAPTALPQGHIVLPPNAYASEPSITHSTNGQINAAMSDPSNTAAARELPQDGRAHAIARSTTNVQPQMATYGAPSRAAPTYGVASTSPSSTRQLAPQTFGVLPPPVSLQNVGQIHGAAQSRPLNRRGIVQPYQVAAPASVVGRHVASSSETLDTNSQGAMTTTTSYPSFPPQEHFGNAAGHPTLPHSTLPQYDRTYNDSFGASGLNVINYPHSSEPIATDIQVLPWVIVL